jgi:hypothetical protein
MKAFLVYNILSTLVSISNVQKNMLRNTRLIYVWSKVFWYHGSTILNIQAV